nr:MAG TPA: chromosome partition protein [Caudoviricetes sp.]
MKIKLLSMYLKNFMCYEEQGFDFHDKTVISGANGKGKSSIASAYTWCLFDCDYEMRSNPVVRREVNGSPVEGDVKVTLVLDMDGREITVRKVQKRTYSKDGSSYKDDNKYFINDVPKTKTAFNEYLEVDNAFKMSSNINAFLNQKSDEVRKFLFQTVKDIPDVSVANKYPDLAELGVLLEKYSVEEISAMNKKKVADIKKELPILEGQIKEKEADIKAKSDMDVSDLEVQKNCLKQKIQENADKQLESEKLYENYNELTDGVLELKMELSGLERKANESLIKSRFALTQGIALKKTELSKTQAAAEDLKNEIFTTGVDIDRLQKKLEGIRIEWKEENERKLDEKSLICPYCKQLYPEEKKAELIDNFEKEKAELLASITTDGNNAKNQLSNRQEDLDVFESNLKEWEKVCKKMTAEIKEMEVKLSELPEKIDISGENEYQEIAKQIVEKENLLKSMENTSEYRKALKEEEQELREELSGCESKILMSNTEAEEKRLADLKEKRTDMVQQQADAEKVLYLLTELEKAKNEELSDQINQRFKLVQWQLFETAKNGNYKSTCVPMVDGKSILTTISNKGNRILGRVDICQSVQDIDGISVPIWVDDCESLDSENQKKVSDMVSGQLIMLVVNDNTKLNVEG